MQHITLNYLLFKLFSYQHGALLVGLAFAWLLSSSTARHARFDMMAGRIFSKVALACVVVLLGYEFIYLLYPGYYDHVEPTIASLGYSIRTGKALYPTPGLDFSQPGLLYGPLLSELVSVSEWITSSPILGPKILCVSAFTLAIFILSQEITSLRARAILMFALPFGALCFCVRSEAFLILLAALTIVSARTLKNRAWLFLSLGAIAGLSSGLKAHGLLYVAAAAIASGATSRLRIAEVALSIIGFSITFTSLFLPQSVEIRAFFSYLSMASHHGLSARIFIENNTLLVLIFVATFFPGLPESLGSKTHRREFLLQFVLLLGIEELVAIAGSKPGAGAWHLLPLFPANALFAQRLHQADEELASGHKLAAALGIALGLAFAYRTTSDILRFIDKWNGVTQAENELNILHSKYKDLVVGIGGNSGYEDTFARVTLMAGGTPQLDAAVIMDYSQAGISDDSLRRDLSVCKFHHLAIPLEGAPFSMSNYYSGRLLLSDKVRQAFRQNYKLVDSSSRYRVYTCGQLVSPGLE